MISQNGVMFLFAFAVIMAIIYTCDNLTTAMLTVSLLTNFVVLATCFRKIHKVRSQDIKDNNASAEPADEEPTDELPKINAFVAAQTKDSPADTPVVQNPGTNYATMPLYEPTHIEASAYRDAYFSYPSPRLCDVSTQTIDNSNISLSRQRARDRRCTDGWASKTSDYYRDNYGTEFVDAENARWWGRHEY